MFGVLWKLFERIADSFCSLVLSLLSSYFPHYKSDDIVDKICFSLSFCFKFSADVSPDSASVESHVDSGEAQSNISKVAVRDKSAKLQSRLNVASHTSEADSK